MQAGGDGWRKVSGVMREEDGSESSHDVHEKTTGSAAGRNRDEDVTRKETSEEKQHV